MLPTIAEILTQNRHDDKTLDEQRARQLVAEGQKQVQLSGPLGAVLTAALKNLYAKPPADDWKVVVKELHTKDGVEVEAALETILLNGAIAAQAQTHHDNYKAAELGKGDIKGFAIDINSLNADPVGINNEIAEDVLLENPQGYTVVIDGVDTTQPLPASVKHTCSCCEDLKVRVVINPTVEINTTHKVDPSKQPPQNGAL